MKNKRELDKRVDRYLKLYPYINKEKMGTLTKDQLIAICIDELLNIMPEKRLNIIMNNSVYWEVVRENMSE
ncbi:hypothetical protein [Lysinibacillus sphaericus]|uniref:hypothetical protein n=1 Tax=Lysinibacillus sphaericus TaxID=1421 RepID=UPI003D7F5B41